MLLALAGASRAVEGGVRVCGRFMWDKRPGMALVSSGKRVLCEGMSVRVQLGKLKNAELLERLSVLAERCNELTAELLEYLAVVEERMLFAELGFPSLHAFCVSELKMSEGAAGRRVVAARAGRRFPELFELIARGELHLSAVCALSPRLTRENAGELFAACAGKARRQVDELLAARFPRADIREEVRRLPGVEPLSAERFGVRFTADAELRDLIEQARELARHRLPSGDLAALMKLALSEFVRSEEKRRFGVGSRKPDKAESAETSSPGGVTRASAATSRGDAKLQTAPPGGVESRATLPGGVKRTRRRIKVAVRREVFERDGGRCSFVSLDGRRCGARAWLEFDHVWPWARRGGDGSENLRLLCGAHNRLHARQCFGALHVAARRAARSGGNSTERSSRIAERSGVENVVRKVRVARCA